MKRLTGMILVLKKTYRKAFHVNDNDRIGTVIAAPLTTRKDTVPTRADVFNTQTMVRIDIRKCRQRHKQMK